MSEDAKMWEALLGLPDAVEHLTHGDPDDADSVKASDAVKWAIAEIDRLREERRWIPVGERLPDGDKWVEFAGPWGNTIGWWDGESWTGVSDETFDSMLVTHWRKRTPGPEAKAKEANRE